MLFLHNSRISKCLLAVVKWISVNSEWFLEISWSRSIKFIDKSLKLSRFILNFYLVKKWMKLEVLIGNSFKRSMTLNWRCKAMNSCAAPNLLWIFSLMQFIHQQMHEKISCFHHPVREEPSKILHRSSDSISHLVDKDASIVTLSYRRINSLM